MEILESCTSLLLGALKLVLLGLFLFIVELLSPSAQVDELRRLVLRDRNEDLARVERGKRCCHMCVSSHLQSNFLDRNFRPLPLNEDTVVAVVVVVAKNNPRHKDKEGECVSRKRVGHFFGRALL